MTLVTTARARLNASISGEAGTPPLVLAHPLGANLSVWSAVAPILAERFHVISFDARGHGGSDVLPGPYSLADLGGDVLALMDSLGLERAHFLGLSMGGAIGQWLTIFAPERLDKLVLANTALHFPDLAAWNARIRTAREKGVAALAPAILARWLTEEFRAARPDAAAKVMKMLEASPGEGYAGCCSALRDADLRDAIHTAPPRPTLVIVGEADGSTPPDRGERLAASLPEARLVWLPSAHLSCVEAEADFCREVIDFLD
jgi:3-oxoadipate enol-lactonase